MMKLAFFVYWTMPPTGSPGHGPIHLLMQSAEELGFSGILSRLVWSSSTAYVDWPYSAFS